MSRWVRAAWAGGLLAGGVSATALLLTAGPADGLRAAPFVTDAVLAVHLLAALPAAYLLAGYLAAGRLAVGVGVAAGLVILALTVWAGPGVGEELEAQDAGFVARATVRTLWVLALQLPWFVAARAWFGDRSRPRRAALGLAVAAAVLVPAGYVVRHTDREAATLADLRRRGRVARAAHVAEALYHLGRERSAPEESATPKTIPQVRGELRARVRELVGAVRTPLPPDAPVTMVVTRGERLAQLDRLAEAEATVRPVAGESPAAALLLAAVLQDGGRYDESSEWYLWALRRRLPLTRPAVVRLPVGVAAAAGCPGGVLTAAGLAGLVGPAIGDCRRAYDGLAFNARRQRKPSESEEWYREALAELPQSAAYFHYQLGMHYTEADRPAAAIEQFAEAARLAPAEFAAPAAERIALLRRDTFGCVVSPTRSPDPAGRSPGR